jgi:ankyrin repeat protein
MEETVVVSIHDVAQSGDLAAVEGILREDPQQLEARDEQGMTPLHMAVQGMRLEVARFLLDRGADVNALNEDERSPLHLAALRGDEAMTRLLLERGAEPNARTRVEVGWRTPLHLAALRGDVAVTRALLERGADPDALDDTDWTPREYAAGWDHHPIAALLGQAAAKEP